MAADLPQLRKDVHKIRSLVRAKKPVDRILASATALAERSAARRAARAAAIPVPSYPPLPVTDRKDDIARAILAHQVVVIAGETGSGKTTQIPKICLELGRGAAGLIGCTQPRRIAARSVASRIAHELGSPLGHAVGYKVRFHDKASPDSLIKVMTDGILLAETQGDPYLGAYDTIVVDEAHERSLNIDFLLGYLKQLLPRRPDLKVIVTSATIDTERFSRHFGGAPVIEVSGRLYPVETRYRPIEAPDEDEETVDLEGAIVDAVDEVARLSRDGDILIFLPGEREIRDTAERLRKHHPPHTEILPLFARQSVQEQERVFKSGGGRRIILSTNVAETSLTVPGIRYVIDPGLARIKRYSYRNKVDQLLVEKISQASANQRTGRCGRVAAGVCIRLYSETDFTARPAFTDPEILRTSLAGTILRMEALKLGAVDQFPFLEAPTPRMIADGYQLLEELNAVDDQGRLTELGRRLSLLPLDPKVGRMLLAAESSQCLTEVLIIAAALSVPDPRLRPAETAGTADERHRRFADEQSDFMAFLKLWHFFDDALQHKKSNRKLVELCHDHFLSHVRLREWRDIHGQLHALVTEMGMKPNADPATFEQIHCALLAGLLGNVGVKTDEGHYQGARGVKFHLSPGSALYKKGPKWVVAGELTETTKLFARTVAKIDPEWLERVAGHMVKRHYFDPHWEKGPARVSAFERLTLYGLTIVPKRRIHFGPINPAESRRIFIRSALVEGEYETRAPFFLHNRKLIDDIRELEHKSRRQDVLVDEDRIFEFFDTRVPPDIHNGAAFDKWRRDAERDNPRLLYMTRDDLMRHGADAVTETLFPETLPVGEAVCPLNYRFEPGHPMDGVTLSVPLHLLNRVDENRCQWLVPGMIREKITALVKGLPKQIRRLCVPVPEFVTAALGAMAFGQGALTGALGEFIRRRYGAEVPSDAWRDAAIPPHLQMNFRVVDEEGRELASSRELADLRKKLGQAASLTFGRSQDTEFERDQITAWNFGDLPDQISFSRDGLQLTGFPALADEGNAVALRLMDTKAVADEATRAGVRRLLRLALAPQMKQLEKSLPGFTQMALTARPIMGADALREDLLTAIADRAFIGDDPLPRTEKQFNAQKDRARTRLPAVTQALCRIAAEIFTEYHAIQGKLAARVPPPVAADAREQLAALLHKDFLSVTPWEHLQHLPRYLKAIHRRLEKLQGNLERDGKNMASIRALWQDYQNRRDKHRKAGISDPELERFRWMLEELRVSLFAQELKTPYPVSFKRVQKAWENVRP